MGLKSRCNSDVRKALTTQHAITNKHQPLSLEFRLHVSLHGSFFKSLKIILTGYAIYYSGTPGRHSLSCGPMDWIHAIFFTFIYRVLKCIKSEKKYPLWLCFCLDYDTYNNLRTEKSYKVNSGFKMFVVIFS